MTKKKFENLGLDNELSSFVTNGNIDENPSFNPLTDKKNNRKRETPKQEVKIGVSIESKNNESIEIDEPFKAHKDSFVPNDFKAHSAIFSKKQLKELRSVVNYIKWKINPKYSIKLAIYEAIESHLKNRKDIKSFPDDFVTYAPLISEEQWDRLNSFIGEVRFKSDEKYAIKYALYEALDMFLKSTPINE